MPFANERPSESPLGRWSVPIPWRRARDLQFRLRERGCPATVCLDPALRAARLEPWPGVDPSHFMAELTALTV